MKKLVLVSLAAISVLIIVLVISSLIIGFAIVKPTTEAINQNLAREFLKIVRIPKGIGPPIQNFDQTIYFWEMETIDREVVGVRFKHQTGFSKDRNIIEAVLEMEEKGDPSIFVKVLPAVITDNQSLKSSQDVEKANLSANNQTGYRSIKLAIKPETKQAVKIAWEFEKATFTPEVTQLYLRLTSFPQPVLRILYSLPQFTLSLLGA